MKHVIERFVREDKGQDLIEYGLLLGIITLACLIAIQGIGGKTGAYFTSIDGLLT